MTIIAAKIPILLSVNTVLHVFYFIFKVLPIQGYSLERLGQFHMTIYLH